MAGMKDRNLALSLAIENCQRFKEAVVLIQAQTGCPLDEVLWELIAFSIDTWHVAVRKRQADEAKRN